MDKSSNRTFLILAIVTLIGCRKDNPTGSNGAATSRLSEASVTGQPPSSSQTTLRGLQLAVATTHACAITADQRVHCWGSNTHGQLGNGTLTSSYTQPVAVRGLTEVTRIAVDAHASCAIKRDGTVWCWGKGDMLGRGDSHHADVNVPHQVPGVTTGTELALGYGHALVVLGDGSVACWGDNDQNSCGRDSVGPNGIKRVEWPSTVPSASRAQRVVAGYGGGCALRTDREVRCWGRLARLSTRNTEQITMGGSTLCVRASAAIWGCTSRDAADPSQILPSALPTAKQLSVDDQRTFGISADDTVVAVGVDSFEVGPKRVSLPTFKQAFRVAHSATNVCTLDRDGAAHCAGLWSDDLANAQYDGVYDCTFTATHDDTASNAAPPPPLPPGRLVLPTYARGPIFPDGTPVNDKSVVLPGDTVQVLWDKQAWYEAWVLEVLPDGVRVEYNDRSRQTVARNVLRQGPIRVVSVLDRYDGPQVDASTPLTVGTKVYVRQSSRWYPGTVVALAEPKVVVQLDGYSEEQRQSVNRTSLRLQKQ